MQRIFQVVAVICVVFTLVGVEAKAGVVDIDTLDNGSLGFFLRGYGSYTGSESVSDGVIGGTRGVSMSALGSGGYGIVHGDVYNGGFLMGSVMGAATYYGQWTLTYDASGAGLAADLIDGTNDALKVAFGTIDHTFTLDVTVTDGDGTVDSVTRSLVASGDCTVLFSDFSSDIDFADVDKIEVRVTGVASGDYNITEIATVSAPEPATLSLLGLGALGLLRRRRK